MRYSACKLHVTLASYIIKVAQYPGFLRLTNLEIHAGRLFAFLICQQIVSFGSHQSFTVHILGDFPHVLWVLPSNNQFIIKLVKMWPGGTPRGGRTFKISLDRLHYTPVERKKSQVIIVMLRKATKAHVYL